MMRLAVLADETVDMTALPQTVADDHREEGERQAGSEEARKALLDREAGGASAHAARGAEQLFDSGGLLERGGGPPASGGSARNGESGRIGRHRLQVASSTIHCTSSPNV
jgi:hypothetical protein